VQLNPRDLSLIQLDVLAQGIACGCRHRPRVVALPRFGEYQLVSLAGLVLDLDLDLDS
jgi:hypothetical protein